jgi:hypothetical protein
MDDLKNINFKKKMALLTTAFLISVGSSQATMAQDARTPSTEEIKQTAMKQVEMIDEKASLDLTPEQKERLIKSITDYGIQQKKMEADYQRQTVSLQKEYQNQMIEADTSLQDSISSIMNKEQRKSLEAFQKEQMRIEKEKEKERMAKIQAEWEAKSSQVKNK